VRLKNTHLHYFVTVAEEGQFSRAAAKLKIAQPTLSSTIARLEAQLGFKLFERNSHGVELTAAGAEFLPKARLSVAAEYEAEAEVQALRRVSQGRLEVGFIGPPPTMTAPKLFAALADAHPDAEVSLRDLPFPTGTTEAWLSSVDVAFCHPPDVGEGIRVHPLRREPRAVIAPSTHPLSGRTQISFLDVLDETFLSHAPTVQAAWAGFHSLDDHRGGPPTAVTDDDAATSMQMLAIMTKCDGITTIPLCDGKLIAQAVGDLVAIPLEDAEPAVLSLVWHSGHVNPLVTALVEAATRLAGQI
jgi:DNA-binding transcriptional LysR family regulator